MTSQAVLAYTAAIFGAAAPAQAAISAVPVPSAFLSAVGLLLKSDVTVGGNRTVTLGLQPTSSATATAALQPGASLNPGTNNPGSPVASLTLGAGGAGYAAPPVVQITPAAGDTTGNGAAGRASLNVQSIAVTAPGSGYIAPVVTLVGGLSPGGVAATATATLAGNTISSITVTSAGSGYVSIPTVVITDSAGSGAAATAVLHVSGLTLTNGGQGYQLTPTVTIVDLFQVLFPTAAAQAAVLTNLMTVGIQKAAMVQVVASVPLVT